MGVDVVSLLSSSLFQTVDNTTTPQALMAALENDDSPLSYGRAFHAAALIPNADLTDLFDQIEDIVAQADETPTTLYVCIKTNLTNLRFYVSLLLSSMTEV